MLLVAYQRSVFDITLQIRKHNALIAGNEGIMGECVESQASKISAVWNMRKRACEAVDLLSALFFDKPGNAVLNIISSDIEFDAGGNAWCAVFPKQEGIGKCNVCEEDYQMIILLTGQSTYSYQP